jgi:hypothetical protein
MKGMGNMMKQAQKLQSKMMRMQEELAGKTIETTAGGGMITVVANGAQQSTRPRPSSWPSLRLSGGRCACGANLARSALHRFVAPRTIRRKPLSQRSGSLRVMPPAVPYLSGA